jgi:hypothetical protein
MVVEVAAMSRAYAAADKHMESERRHSNELIREMRSIVAVRTSRDASQPLPLTLRSSGIAEETFALAHVSS